MAEPPVIVKSSGQRVPVSELVDLGVPGVDEGCLAVLAPHRHVSHLPVGHAHLCRHLPDKIRTRSEKNENHTAVDSGSEKQAHCLIYAIYVHYIQGGPQKSKPLPNDQKNRIKSF